MRRSTSTPEILSALYTAVVLIRLGAAAGGRGGGGLGTAWQKNHLSGLLHTFLKVSCYNVQDLMEVRKEVLPLSVRNRAREEAADAYDDLNANRCDRASTPDASPTSEWLLAGAQ